MPAPDTVLVSVSPGETRLALMAADEVVELLVDRGGLAVGDVVGGRVLAVNRDLNAAFIEIGEPRPGFLGRPGTLAEGDSVAVQVSAAARHDKGAGLRRAPEPVDLRRPSPLARMLGVWSGVARVLADDAATLAAIRADCSAARLERDCFESRGAADALEQALDPVVPLADRARLIIESTAGATVIDIDSGGAAPLAANLAAMPEIARQLRLRALAGHLLVDVIPLGRRRPLTPVVEALREAVARDPTPTHLVGVTPLGMIELMRERRRPSLGEVMLDPPACRASAETLALAALRAVLRQVERQPGRRPLLAAAPAVIEALGRHPAALAEMQRRLGQRLELRSDPAVERFTVMEA